MPPTGGGANRARGHSPDMDEGSSPITRVARDLPLTEVPCPACVEPTFEAKLVRNSFLFVECRRCSTLYVRARPLEEPLLRIYVRFPQLANGREGQLTDDPKDGAREADYRLRRLLEFVKSGRLLDLGCGRGDFLVAANRHFDVQGVDIAPRLRPIASGLRVFKGQLEEAVFRDQSFDVVSAVEVIEHLFDPRRTFREISRVMKPRGFLLLQTGDADSLRARLNLGTWTYLQPPIHLNVFSRHGLSRLATHFGFSQIKLWSFGRAPQRIPGRVDLWKSERLRPVLDWTALLGLIGPMYLWQKVD